jgi:hypothetical protein
MYGKHFASMYTGSMIGAGPVVFAVWGFVIANARNGSLELNAKFLAPLIGTTQEEITQAIETLCSTDPESRNKEHEGRRLIKVGQFLYEVPNHERYRLMRNEDDRREYLRIKKQEQRERDKAKAVNKCQQGQQMSTQSEAEPSFLAKKPKSVFQPPDIRQIRAYFLELKLPESQAEAFADHHKARGWKLSKGLPMRDWEAAARTWKRNYSKFNHGAGASPSRPAQKYEIAE